MSDSDKIRELIGRLGALEPAHVSFDELAGYVDGTLDPVSRELVTAHTAECGRCRRELLDLQQFAAPARRRAWPWAAAVSGVAAAVVLLFVLMRPASAPVTRELHIPPVALELRTQTMALRGPTAAGGPEPLAPLGAIVMNDRPSFTWRAIPNARYRVEVFDSSFRGITASDLVDGSRWTPPEPLPRGRTYLWQITAYTRNGSVTAPRPPSPEARFMVLDGPHANALAELERSVARPSLALGVAYAEAGVLDAAERELRAVDNAEARRFLRVLSQTTR